MKKLKEHAWLPALLALVMSIAALTVSISVTDEPTPTGGHHKTFSFHFDRSGEPGVQPKAVAIPAPVAASVQQTFDDLHVKDETPPGTTPQDVQAEQQAQADIKAALPPLPTAGATAGVPGCRTAFISSYGTRHGVRPTQFWVHYAVVRNVAGWSDVYAVARLFANRANEASSHFIIDAEGHCLYIVPIEFKAWTQAGANAFGVNVEVIDQGNESVFLPAAGMKKLASVFHTVSQRTGIPLQLGAVTNCTPTRAGIVTHWMGGPCSGGHVDIKPFDIGLVIAQIRASYRTPKKVVWLRHRQAVHVTYQKQCKSRRQRRAHAKSCAQLRARGRQLDALLRRRS